MLSGNEGGREEVPTVERLLMEEAGYRGISDALTSDKCPRCIEEESKAQSLRWTHHGSQMG